MFLLFFCVPKKNVDVASSHHQLTVRQIAGINELEAEELPNRSPGFPELGSWEVWEKVDM